MDAPAVSEDELAEIYTWVDQFPLSRPKRNISRDFADGLLVAEIIHHLLPKYIELHNYSQANSTKEKYYNWNTLNSIFIKDLPNPSETTKRLAACLLLREIKKELLDQWQNLLFSCLGKCSSLSI